MCGCFSMVVACCKFTGLVCSTGSQLSNSHELAYQHYYYLIFSVSLFIRFLFLLSLLSLYLLFSCRVSFKLFLDREPILNTR
uniref:Uncharacterized protein n=1 Tax=Rhizophora mucronata TaxID=61149 RepID=A0A2P2PKL8_RHIMU